MDFVQGSSDVGNFPAPSDDQSDSFLTTRPEMTPFKTDINRHTNFTFDYRKNVFDSTLNWGTGTTCTISKYGDLIGRTFLVLQLNNSCLPLDDDDMVDWFSDQTDRMFGTGASSGTSASNGATASTGTIGTTGATATEFRRLESCIDRLVGMDAPTIERYMSNPFLVAVGTANNTDQNLLSVSGIVEAISKETIQAKKANTANTANTADRINRWLNGAKQQSAKQAFNLYCLTEVDDYITITEQLKTALSAKDVSKTVNDYIVSPIDPPTSTPADVPISLMQIKIRIKRLLEKERQHVFHRLRARILPIRYKERLDLMAVLSAEVRIGDDSLDRQTIHQMRMEASVDRSTLRTEYAHMTTLVSDEYTCGTQSIQIPLNFWWTKSTTQYLPLVALRYEDLVVEITLNELSKIVQNTPTELAIMSKAKFGFGTSIVDSFILSEYVFLSKPERDNFCTKSLEYVVHSHSQITSSVSASFVDIPFDSKLSVLGLCWAVWSPKTDQYVPIESCQIVFTGEYRTEVSEGSYYSTIQPWCHFSSSGQTGQVGQVGQTGQTGQVGQVGQASNFQSFYFLNFALHPQQHQPHHHTCGVPHSLLPGLRGHGAVCRVLVDLRRPCGHDR